MQNKRNKNLFAFCELFGQTSYSNHGAVTNKDANNLTLTQKIQGVKTDEKLLHYTPVINSQEEGTLPNGLIPLPPHVCLK